MRLLPRSLKGQLIALTLVALLGSQFAALLVSLNDRRSALTTEWFRNLMTRTEVVVYLLDATPADIHQKILKTSSLGAIRFSIADAPHQTEQHEEDGTELRAEMYKVFGDKTSQYKLTTFPALDEATRIELLFGDLYRDIRRTLFPRSSFAPQPPVRLVFALISIPLKSREWLNITVSSRPFAPPATPLLVQLLTMAIFSAISIVVVINRVTRPMKKLAVAASALGRGESGVKLQEEGPREIVETVRAFNEMQDRLRRFVQDRTKMLAALGHDLRTPITSLRLRAEFIEDEEIKAKIIETLDEMLQMAEATLSFAREESTHEETRVVDFGALVSTVCADLADTGRDVVCEDTDGLAVRCRPIGVKRALRNIVENAVIYGKRATVSVSHNTAEVTVQVDDDGPGIPAEDIEKVFKPFVRLENSRSRDTGGVGLGLAIARSIIRAHGGDITLHNRPEGGIRATLSIPGVDVQALARPAPPKDKEAA